MATLDATKCEEQMFGGFGYWLGGWLSDARPRSFVVVFVPTWLAGGALLLLVASFGALGKSPPTPTAPVSEPTMKTSQLIIRLVVFCCVALSPSSDGTELGIAILLGIALGCVVGIFDAKTGLVPRSERKADSK